MAVVSKCKDCAIIITSLLVICILRLQVFCLCFFLCLALSLNYFHLNALRPCYVVDGFLVVLVKVKLSYPIVM